MRYVNFQKHIPELCMLFDAGHVLAGAQPGWLVQTDYIAIEGECSAFVQGAQRD